MHLAIINGSMREHNTTMTVSHVVKRVANARRLEADIINLEAFAEIFRGTYITLE